MAGRQEPGDEPGDLLGAVALVDRQPAVRLAHHQVQPLLHRGRLVGRLEPSYDRRAKLLTIKSLHFEPNVKVTPPLVAAIAKAIEDLLLFLGAEPGSWRLLESQPTEYLALFARHTTSPQ